MMLFFAQLSSLYPRFPPADCGVFREYIITRDYLLIWLVLFRLMMRPHSVWTFGAKTEIKTSPTETDPVHLRLQNTLPLIR